MPTLLNQMRNPEMQNLLTNPQALGAIQQIQQGLDQLQSVAPSLATQYVRAFLPFILLSLCVR